MNAERLLAHYHRIADAPDAVMHLRAFIVQAAVQGELVKPRPSDEQASKLLGRLLAERSRRLASSEFEEPRSFTQIERASLPFTPPARWEWARLIDLASPSYGFAFASSRFNSVKRGLPLIRIRDISNADTEAYFDGDYDATYIVKAGDYLVGMDGEFKLRRWGGKEALLNQRVMRINNWRCGVDPEFLRIPLQLILDFLNGRSSQTTVKHLSAKQANGVELPLPPLAEQRRIVAKVDELMALCDQLEAAREKREATRDRLTTAALARLKVVKPDTFHSVARFAIDALPALTAKADQIQQLRQSILDLAVRGRLVPFLESEQTAHDFLRRIAAAKVRRAAATRDARIRDSQNPSAGDLNIALPSHWSVQSFEGLFLFIDYRGKTPHKVASGVPLITAKNIRMGHLNREPREFIAESNYKSWMTRGFPEVGDLLFTTEAPLANVCTNGLTEPFALAQRVICLQPFARINTRFFMFAMMSDAVQSMILRHATGMTAKGIKAAKLKPLPLPVPPEEEQDRIVARIDELMAVCDQLESSIAKRDEARRRVLESLLHEALEAEPGEAA